ncbi:PREDICTED: uncharacterized protein LOC100640101 [Amphimedon queenslandica]|uniref:Uncharacterized protein n=1 Tax=Amphimedon queenslandica TaxID=400682 RepID=A0A1X7VNM2_AMPQE|nr:PREDICTED: uncharacterized protein LOC100640101 [Amphimedon queenslandica]|eukprot:XP_003383698.1 PREDICTED: uncharacterized protein LOC100640101 [Amphimedon queenslandica]
MGEKKRSQSAAVLLSSGGGPLSLMSCPATRSTVLQQWLTSMRDRGVIVSDAQLRFNRWLALSESSRPISPTIPNKKHPHAIEVSSRPVTAPASIDGTFVVEHTRTSRMRLERLKAKKPEADYNKIARTRKVFGQHCNHILATPVMAENCSDHESSVHEFLVGSRYNCTHHIDSRSLYRLGVYVPRDNVGSAFINPGGILPPNYHRIRNRSRKSSHSKEAMPPGGFFTNFKIRRGDSSMSINSSLNSTTLFSNETEEKEHLPPPLPPSPPLPPYRHLPSITSKSEGNIEGNNKETIRPKTLSCIELHVPKNTPTHSTLSSTHVDPNSIHKIPAPQSEMNNDEDEGLTISVDAQEYISGHSTPENPPMDDDDECLKETNDENLESVPLEEKEIKEEENEEEVHETIPNEPSQPTSSKVKSESNMQTTSSTVFVDMTKLEEGEQKVPQEEDK